MTGGERTVGERVGWIAGWLAEVYALELKFEAERFLVSLSPEQARELLPSGCSSGLVVVEHEDEVELGIHLAPEDESQEGTVLEETSHLVCVAWHAARNLPVSQLVLELQADVDRFVFARLRADGSSQRRSPGGQGGRARPRSSGTGEPFAHFERCRWAEGLDPECRRRYQLAHERAHRYCRRLDRRFPQRADTPALLSELRRFYRASPDTKLRCEPVL